MPQCLLILQNSDSSERISIKTARSGYPVQRLVPPFGFAPNDGDDRCTWILRTFDGLAAAIEAHIGTGIGIRGVPNCAAVVDIQVEPVRDLSDLNPLSTTPELTWSTVVGMLILAFPEIQWVLANQPGLRVPTMLRNQDGLTPNKLGYDCDIESLLQLQDEGFSPLFDGPGFSSAIREGMIRRTPSAAKDIPIRRSKAASIDEETSYAYVTAYTAYRRGCSSYVVSTYAMMRRLFGSTTAPIVDLTFEDLFLGFPDLDPTRIAEGLDIPQNELHLSNLEIRDRIFPGLADVPLRAFVTVGHEHVKNVSAHNEAYRQRREAGGDGHPCVVFRDIRKPVPGVIDLQRALGSSAPCHISWPPAHTSLNEDLGHSAPGRLLVLAQLLTRRAARILTAGPVTPEQALYGAVLAMNAKEYLQHRTPTASLEALAIQQELEVIAECMFQGVAYNRQLQPRFKDLESEVSSASYWFAKSDQESVKLNSRITILGNLAARFRAFNQIDEELECLNSVRSLHPELWRIQHLRLYSKAGESRTVLQQLRSALAQCTVYLAYGAYWYAAKFMSSLGMAFVILVCWIAVLGIGFAVLQHPQMHCIERLGAGLGDAMISFFGLQAPAADMQWRAWWLVFVAILAGFPHLGLVISYLFSRLVRR